MKEKREKREEKRDIRLIKRQSGLISLIIDFDLIIK